MNNLETQISHVVVYSDGELELNVSMETILFGLLKNS